MADAGHGTRVSVETSTQIFLHVQQHAAGKGDAYERSCAELVARYSDRLFVYLARWVKPQDAEDLLQILFVKVFQNIDRFDRSRARPFTWMCAIARNVFIDSIRRRQNSPELTRFDLEPLDTPVARSEFDALVEWDLWEQPSARSATTSKKRRGKLMCV
jgi:RNA polymerase sigma factor (sigma-70 family)